MTAVGSTPTQSLTLTSWMCATTAALMSGLILSFAALGFAAGWEAPHPMWYAAVGVGVLAGWVAGQRSVCGLG